MTLRASLAMYARPELDAANAEIWTAAREHLHTHGIDAPGKLDPDGVGYDYWEDPNLLVSQTCGYPYRSRLFDTVSLIGTPDYGLEDCPPGYYYSVYLVRRSSHYKTIQDLQGATFAFNDKHSQSGFHGPMAHLGAHGVAANPHLETGAHIASAIAVVQGQCDFAAVDAITWRYMLQSDDFTSDLRIITGSHPVPGLPLITAFAELVLPLRAALRAAFAACPAATAQLGINGLQVFLPETYSASNFQPKLLRTEE
ncbi:MAG: PhnD/SsuA/transferrin family substrate-binding protein [Pseudomonadota bacterium]